MHWPLTDALLFGAARGWTGQAPVSFAPAVLIKENNSNSMLIVGRYIDGLAEGEEVDKDAWMGLLESSEAVEFTERHTAVAGGVIWMLRPSFGRTRATLLEDLHASGAMLCPPIEGPGEVIAVHVDELAAATVRDQWAAKSFDEAWSQALGLCIEEALHAAIRAYLLEWNRLPERLGLMVALLERVGRKTRADGYVSMARRSYGEDFVNQVDLKISEYRTTLSQIEVHLKRAANDSLSVAQSVNPPKVSAAPDVSQPMIKSYYDNERLMPGRLTRLMALDIWGNSLLTPAASRELNGLSAHLICNVVATAVLIGSLTKMIIDSNTLSMGIKLMVSMVSGLSAGGVMLQFNRALICRDTTEHKKGRWPVLSALSRMVPVLSRVGLCMMVTQLGTFPTMSAILGTEIDRRLAEETALSLVSELVRSSGGNSGAHEPAAGSVGNSLSASETKGDDEDLQKLDAEMDKVTVELAQAKFDKTRLDFEVQSNRRRLAHAKEETRRKLQFELDQSIANLTEHERRENELLQRLDRLRVSYNEARSARDGRTVSAISGHEILTENEEIQKSLNELLRALGSPHFDIESLSVETIHLNGLQSVGGIERIRVLSDLLAGAPPRWIAESTDRQVAIEEYGLSILFSPDASKIREADSIIYRLIFWVLFGQTFLLFFSGPIARLLASTAVSRYFSSAYQANSGNPEAIRYQGLA